MNTWKVGAQISGGLTAAFAVVVLMQRAGRTSVFLWVFKYWRSNLFDPSTSGWGIPPAIAFLFVLAVVFLLFLRPVMAFMRRSTLREPGAVTAQLKKQLKSTEGGWPVDR